jgi:3-oxoacyl-(acyl-carrier-protein) synthase/malonyl CoA-acyl carrier protein transacylase/acyl carrier protein
LQTPILKQVVKSCGLSDEDAEEIADRFKKAYIPWEENSFPGMLGNVVSGRIANRLDLGGTNCTVDAACASSLAAVRLAISELIEGRADLMLTGGCDAENTILMYMCFSKTPAFSKSGVIRPFDENSDGTLIGEGIGMLALKRLADAERDGDRIYAVIRGIGTSSDGRFKSIYAPRAEGQMVALKRAYADADVNPESIELFEAHGTGTAVGDYTELTALTAVLGEYTDAKQFAAIGSVKSQIGHTKAAAGAAGLIKVALSLHQKVLPATINVENPSEHADFGNTAFYVNSETRPWIRDPQRPQRRAAISSFGFGGTNFHLVLEEHKSSVDNPTVFGPTALTGLWHAEDAAALADTLESGAAPATGAVPPGHARVGFVAATDEEFEALRALAVTQLRAKPDADAWTHPKGVVYRKSGLAGKVAAVFAGQGSQYVNMGRDAAIAIPPVRAAIDAANQEIAGGATLGRAIYPPPAFDAETRTAQQTQLRRTEFAQPAIGALSAGQYRWLTSLGFAAEGAIGHSFGELTALWAAGALDDAAFRKLAVARGAAMAPPVGAPVGFDPGSMAAVRAPLAEVQALIAAYSDVTVCNINAADQIVVGGPTSSIERLVADATTKKVSASQLPVSAAFHTRFVQHAVDAFRSTVDSTPLAAPTIPVYANTPGASYGTDVAANKRVLAEQLRNPVDFASQIKAMYDAGFRVFVEFGPKSVLTGLVSRILAGTDAVAIAMDGGPNKDSEVTAKRAAIELAVLGLPITGIARYDAPVVADPVRKGMIVPLRGINYVTAARRQAFQDAIETPYEPAALAAAPAAEPAPVVVTPDPVLVSDASEYVAESVSSLLSSQVSAHAEFLDGQLATVREVVSTLEQRVQSGPLSGVDGVLRAVQQQGATIADAHVRASEAVLGVVKAFACTGGSTQTATAQVTEAQPVQATAPAPVEVQATTVTAAAVETAPAAPTATEVAVAPAVSSAVTAEVESVLLEIVAEKTGYPTDMLDAGMDIEADLGIDSIKRVQIMGALQEQYPQAGDVEPERLAELRTLGDIIGFIAGAAAETTATATATPESTPAPAATTPAPTAATTTTPEATPAPTVAAAAPSGAAAAQVESVLLEIVAEKTGYPADMLDPSMDIEADLGIDSIKRVQIMGALQEQYPQAGDVEPERLAELRTLGDIITFIAGAAAETTATATPETTPAPTPTAAVTEQTPVVAAPAASSAAAAEVESVLLEIVAEKTGYPADMLDPSMDIEADLGIDSIKRVQIMGALQEQYPQAGDVEPERLAELRTLGDIIGFIAGAAGEVVAAAPFVPAPPAAPSPEPTVSYPSAPGIGRAHAVLQDLPDPDTIVGAYVDQPSALVIDDGSTLTRPLTAALRDRGWQVTVLAQPGVTSAVAGAATLTSWAYEELATAVTAAGRIDLAVQFAAAPATDWATATQRLQHALLGAKAIQPALTATAGEGRSAYVAVTQLDGAAGLSGVDGASALLGGVNGLVKTLAIEAPALFCRTVDVARDLLEPTAVNRLLAEISDAATGLRDVAYDSVARRRTVTLADEPRTTDTTNTTAVSPLTSDDLLVVTGGARGVTAQCLTELTAHWPVGVILLGRTALADEPAWASGLTEQAPLKGAIVKQIASTGEKPTPRAVEKIYREIVGQREVRENIARLTANGSQVTYLPVDIGDRQGLAQALAPYRSKVTGVVHGAGVLADKLIVDKAADDVRRVLDTKLTGLANVLAALDQGRLTQLVFFSSVAGFFGNRGQSDYAMANEALNRVAASLKKANPGIRATSINWGAWDGGMVTAELRKMFEERGVALVPVPTGTGIFTEQFTAAHADDGVILVGPTTPLSTPDSPQGTVQDVTLERSLRGLASHTVLTDHSIGGDPVLPATMALGALVNMVEATSGAAVAEWADFKVYKGVVFDSGAPTRLRLAVSGSGTTRLHAVDGSGRPRPAYGATIRLGATTDRPADRADLARAAAQGGTDAAALYGDGTLFHGPALRGIQRILARDEQRLVLACKLPDHDVAGGAYRGTYHSPVLADLMLQAALVWVRLFRGAASLPLEIGRAQYWEALPDDGDFLVAVEDATAGPAGVTCTVTATAPDGRVLQRFSGVSVVIDPELEAKFAPSRAVAAAA